MTAGGGRLGWASLNNDGLLTRATHLNEDYDRTGVRWFRDEADAVWAELNRRREADRAWAANSTGSLSPP